MLSALVLHVAGFALCLVACNGLQYLRPSISHRVCQKSHLSMSWSFEEGPASMNAVGGVGSQGEYYFIPAKKPTLKEPKGFEGSILDDKGTLPIFPRNNVLLPLGEEYLGVYEMRFRQLINDVGEGGTFGYVYFSVEFSKYAMIGTLTRIIRIERLEDGGMYVLLRGTHRFFMEEIVDEKPYLLAKVQVYRDFAEDASFMRTLELRLLDEVRYSVKLMKLLYPQNNYNINEQVLRHRPLYPVGGDVRAFQLPGMSTTLRQSRFSFAAMDMLKTDAVTKLAALQEHALEKRYARIIAILRESTAFLEGEVTRRGVAPERDLALMRRRFLADRSDLEISTAAKASDKQTLWMPRDADGELLLGPTLMD